MRAYRHLLAGCLLAALCQARAAPAPSAAQTVYAAGDIARCAHPDAAFSGAFDTAAIVAAGLAADPAAVVLTLGDHTYPRGTAREFSDCYGPTWGRFRDRTYPSPGNHEYATARAAPYFAYFGPRAAKGYYSVELGAWHIVSLDSNLAPAAHAAQLAWLRDDLARHPARCTLAYWHHPLYSSGWHGNIATMHDAWEILYGAGAEIVLSGHDHVYERFAPQDANGRRIAARGIRQFVVGTGGAYPTPFGRTAANSEFRDSSHSGVLRLRLLDGGYEWAFLEAAASGPQQGRWADKGAGSCH